MRTIILLAIMITTWAQAQGSLGFAGRINLKGPVTNSVSLDLTKLSSPARLSNFSITYPIPVSGSVQLIAELNGTRYPQMSNTVVGAHTWCFTATDIWFRPDQGDKLILQTTITNSCTAVADFTR